MSAATAGPAIANATAVPRSHRCMIQPLAIGHPPIVMNCAARMLQRGGHRGEVMRGNLSKVSWAYGTFSDGNFIRQTAAGIPHRNALRARRDADVCCRVLLPSMADAPSKEARSSSQKEPIKHRRYSIARQRLTRAIAQD